MTVAEAGQGGPGVSALPSPEWVRVAFDCVMQYGAIQKVAELAALLEVAEQAAPAVVIEVGADEGGTLYGWSQLPSRPDVLAVDLPWGNFRSHTGLPVTHGARLILGDSHAPATLRQVRDWLDGRQADVVFIDADHTYGGVASDFENFRAFARDGALIVFHDILPHPEFAVGVARLWEEIKGKWPSTEIVTGPLTWGGIGILSYTAMPRPPAPARMVRRGGS